MRANKISIDWDKIDVVLLDMDGTLLDQHYEDFFWNELVPKHYAPKLGISIKDASKRLQKLYSKHEGAVKWSDIDFWETELGMKLWDMRYQIKHLVKMHPHTLRFLKFLKRHRKKVYLVTASHEEDIKFKMKHSNIGKYFDGIYTQFEIGRTKYDKAFWKGLQKQIGYEKDKALFADDMEGILKVAKSHGIKWVIFKSKSSSKKPAKIPRGLIYVHHFDDIIPKKK